MRAAAERMTVSVGHLRLVSVDRLHWDSPANHVVNNETKEI